MSGAGNIDSIRSPAKVARGVEDGSMRKTVIILDPETHEEIATRARALGCSWAAQARMLLEVGLETLKADGQ